MDDIKRVAILIACVIGAIALIIVAVALLPFAIIGKFARRAAAWIDKCKDSIERIAYAQKG